MRRTSQHLMLVVTLITTPLAAMPAQASQPTETTARVFHITCQVDQTVRFDWEMTGPTGGDNEVILSAQTISETVRVHQLWRGPLPVGFRPFHEMEPDERSGTVVFKRDGVQVGQQWYIPDACDAPRIQSTTPADGAVGVPPFQLLLAHFSEPLDPFSINRTTFFVKDSSGQLVSGNTAYDNSTRSAIWAVGGAFAQGEIYTATLTTGVADADGVHMLEPFSWSFTTESLSGDITPPSVVDTYPAQAAEGVPINSTITITLSEPLDPQTVNHSSVVLVDADSELIVPVILTFLGDTRVVRLEPIDPLDYGTRYVAAVIGVTDLSGNRLSQTFRLRFTTAKEQIVLLPLVRR